MKKSYIKYIVGGCLAISGVILAAIGLAMGGFDVIRNGVSFSWTEGFVYDNEDLLIEISPSEHEIENLRIDVSTAEITVSYADVEKVVIEAEGVRKNLLKAQVNPTTKTLDITYQLNTFIVFGGPSADITVTLPKGMKFNNADLHLGVGDAQIKDITASSLTIDSGVGDTILSGGSADVVKVDSGVGDIFFNNFKSKTFGADTGVGTLQYDGEIDSNISLSTGVGSITMNIRGNAADYSYAVDKGVGEVTLNGSPLSTMTNASASKLFTINSGVGAVNINIR